jgi:hypothetical protein
MLEEAPTGDGRYTTRQKQTFPAVYLDTCALRAIADGAELESRFTTAIRRRDGTLCLSMMSLNDFANLKDLRHARAVERMIRALFGRLFFIVGCYAPVIFISIVN